MSYKALLLRGCALGVVFVIGVAASDTTTYSYDSLGRLIKTTVSGGPNNGRTDALCFDPASNRSLYYSGTGAAPTCPATPTPSPAPTPTPTPSGNHPPVAVADSYSLVCNSGGGFNLLANDSDPDGDALTLSSVHSNGGISMSVGSATAGIASIGSGSVAGTYTGTYVVSDSHGATATGNVTVTVSHGGPGGC